MRHTSWIGFVLAMIPAAPGRAGDALSDYQSLTGVGPLGQIIGESDETGFAALYGIHISDPAAFSVSTVNGASSGLDTRLYFFTLAGTGIASNDDQNSGEVRSALPLGNLLFTGLKAGDYLLGISTFDTAPYGSNQFLIFPDVTSGVNGPALYDTFAFWADYPESAFGSYQIDLTGASLVTAAKLNVSTTPSSGASGEGAVNITGSGFPSATMTPGDVVVAMGMSRGGEPVAVTVASSVRLLLGTSYRVQFQIPAGLVPGTYFVAINDDASGEANFLGANCSQLNVS